MNLSPLISIIMPAYNASRYIADSINSVIEQTYSNWELLIVNDGSTDDTEEIVKGYSDPRIRYFQKQNGGVSTARNVALSNMAGDFFCFLDSDDELPEDSLKVRVTYLLNNPDVDMLDGVVIIKDEKMHEVKKVFRPTYSGKVAAFYLKLSDEFFFGPNLMIRNKNYNCWFKDGMTHAEDLWFYTELSWKWDLNYGFVNDVVYHYRKQGCSAMSNLKGLENGYWDYFKNASTLPGITASQKRYLKKRIIRIMFCSYFRKREVVNATSVLKRYLI